MRTTAHTFTAHGSWASLIGFSLRLLNLVSHVPAASVYQRNWYLTFHSRSELLPLLLAKFPAPRLHSFEFGISHVRLVMISHCLSAGGFRFLEHPIPAEGLYLPCGWSTGFDYDSPPDLIGVITFRTSEIRLGWVLSVLRRLGVLVQDSKIPVPIDAILSSLLSIIPTIRGDGAYKSSLAFTRPVFPLPGLSSWIGLSLGFIPSFTPHRCQ